MTVEVSRGGRVLYHSDGPRYRPEIELCMLERGYVVKVDGEKITLAEARKRASEAGKKR